MGRCRPGPLIGALGLVLVGCRGETFEHRTVDDEPLLVVQDRGPVIVSGPDTTMALAPTVFAWVDADPAAAAPPAAEAIEAFQQSLSDARPRLREMGVRVEPRSAPAILVELPDSAPLPPRPAGTNTAIGYLLVDITGHVARHDDVLDAGALVCLASHTFELAAPGC